MEHLRTVRREFPTGDKAVLHIESRSGTVRVEGSPRDSVEVEAIIRVWTDLSAEADDAALLVERHMEQDEHRVIVRAPSLTQREGWGAFFGHKSSGIDYHITVPRQTAVRVLSRSGPVQISRINGVVHAEVMSGKIAIDEIQGDVNVSSRSGGVTLESIDGEVTASARSGRIRAKAVTGPAKLEARSGALEVEDMADDVRLIASSGGMTIERACGKVYARTRAGGVRFRGAVRDDVDIEASAGSIQFAADPEFPFFIDAESHVGSVRSELPPRRAGAPGVDGEGPRVRLRTHAGSIRITRA